MSNRLLFRIALAFVLLVGFPAVSPAETLSQGTREFKLRMVPVTLDGEQVRLAFRIYEPGGTGPYPTLIFNHGSTGRGTDPELFADTWEKIELAEYFTGRGWLVIAPARRGRGGSEGLYDEGFEKNRSRGYTCRTKRSLAGAERALTDLDGIVKAVVAMPMVDSTRLLIGGSSRGGVLSIAHAGLRPERYRGVVNFVGGWVGDGCRTATRINQTLFKKGSTFPKETLWLYGRGDEYYSSAHTWRNLKAFTKAGGTGTFLDDFPGNPGHGLAYYPELWGDAVDAYLGRLGLN